MCLKHDSLMTFQGSANLAHIMQKAVKMALKKTRKWANGQNFYDFETVINPMGYSDSALGLYTCI